MQLGYRHAVRSQNRSFPRQRSQIPGAKNGGRQDAVLAPCHRHGRLAECVVLHNESEEVFDDLLAQYYRRLGPSDDMEAGIIDEMAAAFWRIRRAWAIENQYPEPRPRPWPPSAPSPARKKGITKRTY